MRIKLKKDYKDPRPNRNKTFKAGKEIMCDRSFGEKLVKEGIAVEFEPVNIAEEIKKQELKKLKKDGSNSN